MVKGATLFALWGGGNPHRATRDVDLLGFGSREPSAIREVFAAVLDTKVDDDGVSFDVGSLEAAPIREEKNPEYGGVRVLLCSYHQGRAHAFRSTSVTPMS